MTIGNVQPLLSDEKSRRNPAKQKKFEGIRPSGKKTLETIELISVYLPLESNSLSNGSAAVTGEQKK